MSYQPFEKDDAPVSRQFSIRPSIGIAAVAVGLVVALFLTTDRLSLGQNTIAWIALAAVAAIAVCLYIREECVISEIERAKGRRKSSWG